MDNLGASIGAESSASWLKTTLDTQEALFEDVHQCPKDAQACGNIVLTAQPRNMPKAHEWKLIVRALRERFSEYGAQEEEAEAEAVPTAKRAHHSVRSVLLPGAESR